MNKRKNAPNQGCQQFFLPLVIFILGIAAIGINASVNYLFTSQAVAPTPPDCPLTRYRQDETAAARLTQILTTAGIVLRYVEVWRVEERRDPCQYVQLETSVVVRLIGQDGLEPAELGARIAAVIRALSQAHVGQIDRVQVQFIGADLPIWELSLAVAQGKLSEEVDLAWFYRLGLGE
jgi:hypothetical protein